MYILENSPLSDVIFTNVFSHSGVYLLILLTLPFTEQKFFILMKSSFSISCFIGHQAFCFHMLKKGGIVYSFWKDYWATAIKHSAQCLAHYNIQLMMICIRPLI